MSKMNWKNLWENVKAKTVEITHKAIQFAKENPEACGVIFTVGTAAVGGIAKGVKAIHRCSVNRQAKYLKERYIYDRSLGMYLKTRRPLRNNDYYQINERRRRGERLADILASMRLLQ